MKLPWEALELLVHDAERGAAARVRRRLDARVPAAERWTWCVWRVPAVAVNSGFSPSRALAQAAASEEMAKLPRCTTAAGSTS